MNTWEIEASTLARFYIYEFSDNFKVFFAISPHFSRSAAWSTGFCRLGGRL